jgi:aerobic carbon-monoxide dehydrogenase large subunit
MNMLKVGQPALRIEDRRLLTGAGHFTDDIAYPAQCYGVMVRSPHAHAAVNEVDVSSALASPGVLTVLIGSTWVNRGLGGLPVAAGKTRPSGKPMYRPEYLPLAVDRVRYVGDPVAFVVAETLEQAEEAAELVLVDYEPLPAVTNVSAAAADDAPLVWEDCEHNICMQHEEGDHAAVQAAFATAAHVVRQRLVISRATAAAMEPRAAVGLYDRGSGRFTLHTPLQRGTNYRHELARTLRIPESRIRVVAGDIGGSFGMKAALYNEAPLVLLAAEQTGRPVKWVATRSESFMSDTHGRDNVTEAALALDAEGRFLALKVETIGNLGAYSQPSSDVGLHGNIGGLAGVYRTPAIHVRTTGYYTNTNPIRPYRGNGRPEASYVIERMVDIAADEMEIDPADLRRRNMIGEDEMPYQTALSFRYDCGAFERVMDEALARADYAGFEKRRQEALARGRFRGIGISSTIERAGVPGSESAELRVDLSGAVTLLAGSISQGQGHETTFKQIVSDRLGIGADTIDFIQGDSDTVPISEGSWGSRTSSIGASAVAAVADRLIDKARKVAARVLGVDAESVEVNEGVFGAPGTNRTLTFAELAQAALSPRSLPEDVDAGLSARIGYKATQQNFPNGTQLFEVEIDPKTGVITIERVTVADDVGTVLNPVLVKGQLLGGIAQGVGQMLMEEIRYEEDSGQLLSGSFMDYAVPRAALLPHVEIVSVPVPTATNPLGAKGAGEGGCVGAVPALANAIVDALSPLGVRHIDMPATPEGVWRAIQSTGGTN